MKKLVRLVVASLVILILALAPMADASTLNSTGAVSLNLSVGVNESISVTCSPTTVNFSGNPGSTIAGNSPVTCTVTYALSNTRSQVALFYYFVGPNALTGPTGSFVLPNNVSISTNGGSFNSCSGSDGFSAYGCENNGTNGHVLATTNSSASVWPSGTVSTTLAIDISLGTSQVIGNYTGTLNVDAQAI